MVFSPTNPLYEALFKPAIQGGTNNYFITKGSLIIFQYSFWINDPYPLVIVSDAMVGNRIRGVNLHYLTYPVISSILSTFCNVNFSYANIKNNQYIKSAFRTYKWGGISQIRKMDCKILLKIISGVRSIDPVQVQAIRQSVEDQLQKMTNPVVDQTPAVTPVVQQAPTTPVVGQNTSDQTNI